MYACDAVIPAYNEGARVAPVVRAVRAAGCCARVLVVDDGSTDDTAAHARAAGAEVHSIANRRKGGAMRYGLEQTRGAVVAFFDADLVGLRPDHVRAMVEPVRAGSWGMVAGLRDYGAARNELSRHLPVITGERAVRRDLLARVPPELWRGYDIEVAINDAVARAGARAGAVVFDGIAIVHRVEKQGWAKGSAAMADMGLGIARAMAEIRARADAEAAAAGAPTGAAQGPVPLPPPATLTAKCDSVACMMDEVTGALVRQAGPLVRDEIVPAVLSNREALDRFGEACGRGAAREVGPWVKLAAFLSAVAAAASLWDRASR